MNVKNNQLQQRLQKRYNYFAWYCNNIKTTADFLLSKEEIENGLHEDVEALKQARHKAFISTDKKYRKYHFDDKGKFTVEFKRDINQWKVTLLDLGMKSRPSYSEDEDIKINYYYNHFVYAMTQTMSLAIFFDREKSKYRWEKQYDLAYEAIQRLKDISSEIRWDGVSVISEWYRYISTICNVTRTEPKMLFGDITQFTSYKPKTYPTIQEMLEWMDTADSILKIKRECEESGYDRYSIDETDDNSEQREKEGRIADLKKELNHNIDMSEQYTQHDIPNIIKELKSITKNNRQYNKPSYFALSVLFVFVYFPIGALFIAGNVGGDNIFFAFTAIVAFFIGVLSILFNVPLKYEKAKSEYESHFEWKDRFLFELKKGFQIEELAILLFWETVLFAIVYYFQNPEKEFYIPQLIAIWIVFNLVRQVYNITLEAIKFLISRRSSISSLKAKISNLQNEIKNITKKAKENREELIKLGVDVDNNPDNFIKDFEWFKQMLKIKEPKKTKKTNKSVLSLKDVIVNIKSKYSRKERLKIFGIGLILFTAILLDYMVISFALVALIFVYGIYQAKKTVKNIDAEEILFKEDVGIKDRIKKAIGTHIDIPYYGFEKVSDKIIDEVYHFFKDKKTEVKVAVRKIKESEIPYDTMDGESLISTTKKYNKCDKLEKEGFAELQKIKAYGTALEQVLKEG